MEQYIKKSALVAEIEKLRDELQEKVETSDFIAGEVFIMNYFISLLDTLEVKEVDFEEEFKKAIPPKYCWSGDGESVYSKEQMRSIAKHFFELGMQVSNKAQKGEEL